MLTVQVEAGELVRVCVNYVRSGLSVVEAQCKAGQQYRYMCHRRGVTLGTPAECGQSSSLMPPVCVWVCGGGGG